MKLLALLRARKLELGIFGVSLAVFCLAAGPALFSQSKAPHFIYQANAWLAGQSHLEVDPPDQEDWARVDDKFYVSFPPFPAVVMLPFVAMHGYQFADVFFTACFGALNVLLMFLVFRKFARAGDAPRSVRDCLWLTGFFAFGTVHFYIVIRGEVWFTAQTLGVTFICLYLLAAHRARHPLLAGFALAAGALTRTPIAFTFVYFAMELFAPDGRFDRDVLTVRRTEVMRKALVFAAPIVVFAAVMMWWNWDRFGSPLEFGHSHLWNNRVNTWVSKYGLFHPHYLEQNLQAAFFQGPRFYASAPFVGFDGHGMSLFLTTPLLALLVWPRQRPRLHRALWGTVVVVAMPALFYQNDGYFQFGYRFSLDWMPFLFLLLAIGGRPMGWRFKLLGLAGVAMGVWGALAFDSGWV